MSRSLKSSNGFVGENRGRGKSSASSGSADETLHERIEKLHEYVRKTPNPGHGLTIRKLQNRAEDYQIEDGKLAFSMLRHHPVGCSHTPGCALAAMTECLCKYVFDPINNTIECQDSVFVRYEITSYELWAAEQYPGMYFHIMKDGLQYIVAERFGNFVMGVVSSYEQAAKNVEAFVRSWELDHVVGDLQDLVSSTELKRIEEKLRAACVSKALDRLKDGWAEMLEEEGYQLNGVDRA